MEPFEKRGNFEQAFSLAFEGAEIAPEPHIWDRIDSALAKDKNSSYKKRLLFFQLVAAASLIFAASITLYQFLGSDNALSDSSINRIEAENTDSDQLGGLEDPDIKSQPPAESARSNTPEKHEPGNISSDEKIADNKSIIPLVKEDDKFTLTDKLAVISDLKEEQLPPQIPETESGEAPILVMIPIEPSSYSIETGIQPYEPVFVPVWTKPETDSKETMWASAGFAAGSYSPSAGGFSLGLGAADAANYSPGSQLDNESVFSDQHGGRSMGGGIGFGGRVSNRWLLESGLNYLHSEIDGTTNSYIESNGNNYPLFYESRIAGFIQNTGYYGITSSLDFISVPFKAGYVLVDKKIGWVATGGLGSNILIGNSLTGDLGQLEKINYSIPDSPYRRFSWTGIIGTEVYFNITDDYQLLVVPQYNFGLSEITRQESSFSIVPNSFNLGIRLRYLLK